MDWDEVRPKPKPGTAIGENLETLSVAELEARILELEREIVRVKAELTLLADGPGAAAAAEADFLRGLWRRSAQKQFWPH